MKSFLWVNEKLSFLDAIVLRDIGAVPRSIRILTSRSLEPHEWDDVEYTVDRSGRDVHVKFARPLNDLHIRIDLIGDIPGAVAVSPQLHRILAAPEITELLKTKRIIFLGCARDCENQIDEAIATLSSFGKHFKDSGIAAFENDSTDSTRDKLSRAAQRGALTLLHDSGLDRYFPKRTARLAHARNQLLQWAMAQDPVDYICFADLDGIVNSDMKVEGFLSNFATEEVWDGVFPVNDDFYYDVWTIRQKDLGYDNYMEVTGRVDASLGKRLAKWIAGYSRQLDLRAMEGWLPVDSAFGGMSIYKHPAIAGQRFVGLDPGGMEVCEHVSVNLNIVRNGGRLFINPLFVVAPVSGKEISGVDVPAGIWSSKHLPRLG
jgi:hypothetical protein